MDIHGLHGNHENFINQQARLTQPAQITKTRGWRRRTPQPSTSIRSLYWSAVSALGSRLRAQSFPGGHATTTPSVR